MTTRARECSAVILAFGMMIAACVTAPNPSDRGTPPLDSPLPSLAPSPRESPSTPATASPALLPTPVPTPPGDLDPEFVLERDGVRIRVTLDRNPLRAGEPTWATTRVRNIGSDPLIWYHDGCAATVHLRGVMEGQAWRTGVSQTGIAQEFKVWVLDHQNITDGAINVTFEKEDNARLGRYGCADVGISDRIAPGDTVRQRRVWDGAVWLRMGPPPSGPLTLVGWAGYFWRERDDMPADIASHHVEFEMASWIVGGRQSNLLHPPEVVDAAVASPAFVSWLATRDLRNANTPVLRYDPVTSLWEVGLLEFEAERFHLALVHPKTGEVVDIVQRPWDPDADGFP